MSILIFLTKFNLFVDIFIWFINLTYNLKKLLKRDYSQSKNCDISYKLKIAK